MSTTVCGAVASVRPHDGGWVHNTGYGAKLPIASYKRSTTSLLINGTVQRLNSAFNAQLNCGSVKSDEPQALIGWCNWCHARTHAPWQTFVPWCIGWQSLNSAADRRNWRHQQPDHYSFSPYIATDDNYANHQPKWTDSAASAKNRIWFPWSGRLFNGRRATKLGDAQFWSARFSIVGATDAASATSGPCVIGSNL